MKKKNAMKNLDKFQLPKTLADFWWVIVIAAATLIISLGANNSLNLQEGQYAPNNVYYFGSAVTYVSQEQTDAARKLAAAEVKDIYEVDDMVIVNVHKEVDEIFEQLYAIRSNSDLGYQKRYAELAAVFGGDIRTAAIDYYMGLSDPDISKLVSQIKDEITQGYAKDVEEADVDGMVAAINKNIDSSNYVATAREFMKDVIGVLDFPASKVIDQVATNDAVNKAMNNVQPIEVNVTPGQLIVRRGEVITPTVMETLKAVGLVSQSGQYAKYLGNLFFVILCFLIIRAYCSAMSFREDKKERSIVVLTLLMLLILFIGRLITLISVNTNDVSDLMLGLLIPVPAFSLLASALVNKRSSILGTAVLSLFIGIMCSGNMLYVMAAMLGGLVGVIETGKMDQRRKYFSVMLYVSGTYCLTLLAWSFIWGYSLSYISAGLIMCAVNGIISVILAIGMLPMLENMFGITTRVHLLELSNTNHPLLKKLMIEAPGTYNHSVLVGNLAEAAAGEIGANGLLVRVASYFHDIGKVKRPYLFIENQKSGDNPHDKLQPSLSTFVITSHTKNGAELARKYKLPKEIIDIILQHHGTSMVVGFYKKAQAQAVARGGKAEEVSEENFRYPGPVPQTKEAALVMLADSCQAAVMAMPGPTRGQIEGRVREVIKGKFDDGQLNECDLTFRDLELIAAAFVNVLAGAHHKRIPYPDQLEKELRSRAGERKKSKDGKGKGESKEKVNGMPVMTEAELEKAVNESLARHEAARKAEKLQAAAKDATEAAEKIRNAVENAEKTAAAKTIESGAGNVGDDKVSKQDEKEQ